MNTWNKPLVLALIVIFASASCKKEFETKPRPANLLEIDFTGEWNAYGYMNFSGPMALETVKIERRSPGSTYYIATKIKGDDAVPGGMVTWHGNINTNPFTTTCILGSGNGHYSEDPGVEFEIVDENTIRNIRYRVVFTRRTVGYF